MRSRSRGARRGNVLRRSHWFSPALYNVESTVETISNSGFHVHMFIEDCGLMIMPIGGRRRRGEFSAKVCGASREDERRIASGISARDRHEFGEALSDFFRDVIQSVLMYGAAYFECVPAVDDESSWTLEWIYTPTIRQERYGEFWQHLPAAYAQEHGIEEQIKLNARDLLIFKLPQPYADLRLQTLLQLRELGEFRFANTIVEQGGLGGPFNFNQYMAFQNRAFLVATEAFGWNGRGSVDEFCLEYLSLERLLTFQRFLADCREAFLKEMNKFVGRFSSDTQDIGPIQVGGLPTHADIEGSLAALRAGPVSFKSIVDPYLT